MPVIETTPPKMDSKSTKAKVADWIVRLNRLYAQLDEWLQDYPHATITRGQTKQVIDPLMKHYKIPARIVPTYTVVLDKKRQVTFIPGSLWIVGANGRVIITTNVRRHVLFDLGGRNGTPSDWQLTVDDARLLVPFDKTAFLRLLGERR